MIQLELVSYQNGQDIDEIKTAMAQSGFSCIKKEKYKRNINIVNGANNCRSSSSNSKSSLNVLKKTTKNKQIGLAK